MDHALTELTSEERSAIYDYVVAQGKAANINNTFQVEELHMNLEKKQGITSYLFSSYMFMVLKSKLSHGIFY